MLCQPSFDLLLGTTFPGSDWQSVGYYCLVFCFPGWKSIWLLEDGFEGVDILLEIFESSESIDEGFEGDEVLDFGVFGMFLGFLAGDWGSCSWVLGVVAFGWAGCSI